MAEEADAGLDDIVEEGEGNETEQKPKKKQQKQQKGKKPCNQRIEELSTPNKRAFLALYTDHSHHLAHEKIEYLKALLQQLYAMTPEESMRYFEQRRAEARALVKRKRFKHTVRSYLLKKRWQKQRECGLKVCKRIIKRGIVYAIKTPIPPIVSERLRILSDVVLEHLAGIMNVGPPCRCNPDNVGKILIAMADWMASLIERLYYQTYVSKMENMYPVQNYDQTAEYTFKPIKNLELSAVNKSYDSKYFAPQMPSILSPNMGRSPRQSRISQIPNQQKFDAGQMVASTPRQSINSQKNKNMSKTSARKAK